MRSDFGEYNSFLPPYRDDPFPALAEARRTAPVFRCPAEEGWIVTRYADAVDVLTDPARFSSVDAFHRLGGYCPEAQRILDQGYAPDELRPLLATDPPWHTVVRRLIASAFTPRRVVGLESPVRKLAEELVDGFAADGHVDLVGRFAYPLPLAVIMELLGVQAADRKAVKRWSDDRVSLYWGDTSTEEQVVCARSLVEFQGYLRDLVEERRARPRDDFVSALVAATTEDGASLSTPEVVGHLLSLIPAGHETTTNLIANGIALLLRHRDQWEALCVDPGLAAAAVEEIVRMDGPAKGMVRTATVDTDLGGVTIGAGERLRVMFGSANRDDSVFPEPDRFDIRRQGSRAHLGFGRGHHFCVGAALARLQGRVALEVLSRRLPTLRLRPGHRLRYQANANLRLLVELPLEWDTDRPHPVTRAATPAGCRRG